MTKKMKQTDKWKSYRPKYKCKIAQINYFKNCLTQYWRKLIKLINGRVMDQNINEKLSKLITEKNWYHNIGKKNEANKA